MQLLKSVQFIFHTDGTKSWFYSSVSMIPIMISQSQLTERPYSDEHKTLDRRSMHEKSFAFTWVTSHARKCKQKSIRSRFL